MRIIHTILFFIMSAGFSAFAQDILDFHPAREVIPRLLTARKPAVVGGSSQAASSWTVLQFSDIHGDTENLARIARFRETYAPYIDAAIHTGDAVACYYDDPNPWATAEGASSLMNVVGNHDCWKGHLVWAQSDWPYDATQEEAYQLLLAPYIAYWDVTQPEGVNQPESKHYRACYYYKDYVASGIRMIVLDCMHYNDAQHAWFQGILSDAAAKNLIVVAVQHYPAQNGLQLIPSGFSDLDETLGAEPDPPAGKQMERMTDRAFEAVDAFMDGGGTFVCWLSGHTHLDFIGHVNGHLKQLQLIVDKAGEGDAYMQEDRSRGTVNQDAFNLVTVNPSRNLLIIDRIGCQRDQYMRSKRLLVYDYSQKEVLVNE